MVFSEKITALDHPEYIIYCTPYIRYYSRYIYSRASCYLKIYFNYFLSAASQILRADRLGQSLLYAITTPTEYVIFSAKWKVIISYLTQNSPLK